MEDWGKLLLPELLVLLLTAGGGYLLGSIPFGLIATRLGGAGDIRKIGSGNIGATNVLRSGRKDLALLTLLGDGGKGAVAVLIAGFLTRNTDPSYGGGLFNGSDSVMALAGASAFIGHLFPVWLKFKGGKGVATFYGVLFAMSWPLGLFAALVWIGMALVFRISSLAALTAAALTPLVAWMFERWGHGPLPGNAPGWAQGLAAHTGHTHGLTLLALVMAVLIFIRHQPNIARLSKGEEPRIGKRKPAAAG